jgi:tetratricopeptide (TPR) repeat protein
MHALMTIRRAGCLVFIAAALMAGGCASKQSSTSNKDGHFDAGKEPEFTPQTHYAAGQLAESQGNVAAAIAQYEAAVKGDQKHAASLYRLGVLHAQKKEFNEAINAWKQYVKATDGNPTGFSNLGFCCELAGRRDDAEISYKKGIAKDPKNVPCRVNYGLMLARHGHISEATIQLQTVLTAAEVHYNLASVFEAQGRKSQARAEYEKAVTLNPGFGDAKQRLASIDKE